MASSVGNYVPLEKWSFLYEMMTYERWSGCLWGKNHHVVTRPVMGWGSVIRSIKSSDWADAPIILIKWKWYIQDWARARLESSRNEQAAQVPCHPLLSHQFLSLSTHLQVYGPCLWTRWKIPNLNQGISCFCGCKLKIYSSCHTAPLSGGTESKLQIFLIELQVVYL